MLVAIPRRARPWPNHSALPFSARASSARCTVRGLTSSANANAELDQASPSARSVSTSPLSFSMGGASTETALALWGFKTNPRSVACISASGLIASRKRPISTRSRARCDSSASRARKARMRSSSRLASSGQSSPSTRMSANRTGRLAREMMIDPARTTFRHASMMSESEAMRASTSSRQRSRSPSRAIRRAAGASNACTARSTSTFNAAFPTSAAALLARSSASRAGFAWMRLIAMPATTIA